MPNVTREGDDFKVRWPAGYVMTVAHVRERYGKVEGEASFSANGSGHTSATRIDLLSATDRYTLTRTLVSLTGEKGTAPVNWKDYVEQGCDAVLTQWRRSRPVVTLADVAPTERARDLIRSFIPAGETSVVFGDGGSMKSILLLLIGLMVAAGLCIIDGWQPQEYGSVLYLDWETNEGEQRDRLASLCAGLGTPVPRTFHYRAMDRPLADVAADIRQVVDELGVVLVLVDSLGPAAGNDLSNDATATATMNALRSLGSGVTRLAAAHISKSGASGKDRATIFGSVFWTNLARSVWHMRRSDAAAEGTISGLFHTKVNRGRLKDPLALHVRFDGDDLPQSVERKSIDACPDLLDYIPVKQRIREALRQGKMSTPELAAWLEMDENAVRAHLHKMTDVVNFNAGPGGRGKAGEWGLKAHHQTATGTDYTEDW